LLFAVASAACGVEPEIGELDLAAAAPVKARVKKRTLYVTGNGASSRVALRLGPTGLLEVDLGDDQVADKSFDRATFERIVIDAGGGDDVVRIDDSGGLFTDTELTTVSGGNGNDTLLGGFGAETFFGGGGNDVIDAGGNSDVIFMGAGDDVFVWQPGRGSDVVEGENGFDTMRFGGANVGEIFEIAADEERVRFTRNVASVTTDLDGVERIELAALGGADAVIVRDLSGTALAHLGVDLTGDAAADIVTLEAVAIVDVLAEGGALLARGLGAEVRVTNGEPADRMLVNGAAGTLMRVNGAEGADQIVVISESGLPVVQLAGASTLAAPSGMTALEVHGRGGDDTISAVGGLAAGVFFDGGEGDDVISGSVRDDVLIGGEGNDLLDGQQGADGIFMGAGDDVFNWDPGDGSDVVEGQDGADVLRFNGSGAGEQLRLEASGARLRFTRDIGLVALDLASVETAQLRTSGGSDSVVVRDLAGTPTTRVEIELALFGGGADALADIVTVEGSPAADVIAVATDGAALVATGLAAEVRVTGGDLGLDRLFVNGGPGDAMHVNGTEAADQILVISDGGIPVVQLEGASLLAAPAGQASLAVFGHGGDDTISAVGAVSMGMRFDGGDGDDVLFGSYREDLLIGGPGNDRLDGQQGADVLDLGAGDDTANWDPGDGSDVVEGGDGRDTLAFNGSGASETMELGAIGARVRLFRDIGIVAQELGDVERVAIRAFGGSDRLTVHDLAGTAVAEVDVDLGLFAGGGDALIDAVHVNGTHADDTIAIAADGATVVTSGLAASVTVYGAEPTDQLVVSGLGGIDAISVGAGVEALISLLVLQD
jgi:Ca2+-binding RTX toxin-like protein